MRKFILLFAFFCSVFALEKEVFPWRLDLPGENLVLCENGIFLLTDSHGRVPLSCLMTDDEGYYVLVHVDFICLECDSSLSSNEELCPCCGSDKLDIIGVGQKGEVDLFLVTALFEDTYVNPIFCRGGMVLCESSIGGHAEADTDGNASIGGDYTYENEDKTVEIKGSGEVRQDSEGNVKGEIKVEGRVRF